MLWPTPRCVRVRGQWRLLHVCFDLVSHCDNSTSRYPPSPYYCCLNIRFTVCDGSDVLTFVTDSPVLRPKPFQPHLSISISAPPKFCYVRPPPTRLSPISCVMMCTVHIRLTLLPVNIVQHSLFRGRRSRPKWRWSTRFWTYVLVYCDIASVRGSCWLVRKDQSGLPAWWPTMPLGTLLDWIPPGPTMSPGAAVPLCTPHGRNPPGPHAASCLPGLS